MAGGGAVVHLQESGCPGKEDNLHALLFTQLSQNTESYLPFASLAIKLGKLEPSYLLILQKLMHRRKFLTYSAATGFVTTLNLLRPQKADAFIFALLGRSLLQSMVSMLARSAFSMGMESYSRRDQAWFDRRMEAQLSQREFIARNFTNIGAAEGISDPTYRYVVAAERNGAKGSIPAISFPQLQGNISSVATYAGPTCIGMAVASHYLLMNNRLPSSQINSLIIPRFQAYDNWHDWDKSPALVNYPTLASDRGILIRYDMINSGHNGYGTIDVTINSVVRIAVPTIRVDFV